MRVFELNCKLDEYYRCLKLTIEASLNAGFFTMLFKKHVLQRIMTIYEIFEIKHNF